jgi:MerR family regulatory protein
MGEDRHTTYRISEAARELGISIEWLRAGERRGFFPAALRDRNGHRYTTIREEIGEDSAADSCPRHGFLWGESLQHINGHCSESLRICLGPRLGRRS